MVLACRRQREIDPPGEGGGGGRKLFLTVHEGDKPGNN